MSAARRSTSHLVIGGGLAGSMLGLRLAAAGCEVTLLERERTAHHKVCGEFLSPEAASYLRQAGIEPLNLGAVIIRFVRLSVKRRVVEAALPFTALSLSRYMLDGAMLDRAAESGCEVIRGAFVEHLSASYGEWVAELREGGSWRAQTVFLANGKHDLRGWDRARAAPGDLIGFKLHWRLAPAQTEALREFMELFLFTGGYGGLSLVEDGVANLCLVVRRSVLRKTGGWTELLAAIQDENRHMRQRLQGATALWERPLAISPIPYGYLASQPCAVWRVGDQAAVIPSFTGDGMAIALHSAALAAEMFLSGETADQYYRRLHVQLSRGMRLAGWLSRVMVSGLGRRIAPAVLSLLPHSMPWIARSTRIPEHALISLET